MVTLDHIETGETMILDARAQHRLFVLNHVVDRWIPHPRWARSGRQAETFGEFGIRRGWVTMWTSSKHRRSHPLRWPGDFAADHFSKPGVVVL